MIDRTSSAGYMTSWAARLFVRYMQGEVSKVGVQPGCLPVFAALGRGEALSQTALAQFISIEQPTMAATLARMERDGLVSRERDPNDGRSYLYRLTPMAVKKKPALMAIVEACNAGALHGLSQAEQTAFIRTLSKVAGNLEAMLESRSQAG